MALGEGVGDTGLCSAVSGMGVLPVAFWHVDEIG